MVIGYVVVGNIKLVGGGVVRVVVGNGIYGYVVGYGNSVGRRVVVVNSLVIIGGGAVDHIGPSGELNDVQRSLVRHETPFSVPHPKKSS